MGPASPTHRTRRWRAVLVPLLGCCLGVARASPLADAEIAHLVRQLGVSPCQFERNGTLYPAAEAAAHLQKKQAYMARLGSDFTADQFIAEAASQSSMSGQSYWVRCQGQPAVESKVWLTQELVRYRSGVKFTPPSGNTPQPK